MKLDMPDGDCYVISEHAGLFELCVDLGATVRKGDVIARIHDPTRTGATPVEYRAKMAGLLIGRHFPGLIQSGDFLAAIAVAV
jgi:N-alpha-acetyl-L-2,4-diaminobutyrate deacetylase